MDSKVLSAERGQGRDYFGDFEQCFGLHFPAADSMKAPGITDSAASTGESGRWPLRAAEARSRDGGCPLALFDDDAGFIGIG